MAESKKNIHQTSGEFTPDGSPLSENQEYAGHDESKENSTLAHNTEQKNSRSSSTKKKKSPSRKKTSRKKSTKRKKKSSSRGFKFTKNVLLFLKELFEEKERIGSSKELEKLISPVLSVHSISFNTFKQKASNKGLLEYLRKKPVGYRINWDVWNTLFEEAEEGPSITKERDTPEERSSITHSPQKREDTSNTSQISPIKQVHDDTQAPSPTRDHPKKASSPKETKRLEQEKKEESSSQQKSSPSSSTSVHQIRSPSTEDILNTIPSFPNYLLSRIQESSQKALKIGILELNRMSIKNLEKVAEALSSSRMFFDDAYENEKEILDYIDKKLKYVYNLLEAAHEKHAEELIIRFIKEPMKKGKFNKIIAKWGNEYGIDECAYEILRKIGRKARKIPLSEYALRERIKELLRELYPNKE